MSNSGARFQFRNRAVMRVTSRQLALLAMGVLFGSGWVMAESAPRPESLIKYRQSAYQVLAWNSGRIRNALAGPWDAHEVQSAANALAAVANSGLTGLFPAGTAQGKGWRATTVAPGAFTEPAKFRELNDDFARQASELARIAAGGDAKAVNDQFLKVAQACKSCHERFRQTD